MISMPSQVYGEKWVYVSQLGNLWAIYFDSDSIRINKRESLVRVWVKRDIFGDYKKVFKRNMYYLSVSPRKWHQLDYSKELFYFNYDDETYAIGNRIWYSFHNKVLDTAKFELDDWNPIKLTSCLFFNDMIYSINPIY